MRNKTKKMKKVYEEVGKEEVREFILTLISLTKNLVYMNIEAQM